MVIPELTSLLVVTAIYGRYISKNTRLLIVHHGWYIVLDE